MKVSRDLGTGRALFSARNSPLLNFHTRQLARELIRVVDEQRGVEFALEGYNQSFASRTAEAVKYEIQNKDKTGTTKPVGGTVNVKKWVYMPYLAREVPIVDGVMTAEGSTGIFLALIKDISKKLPGKVAFQIGPNQGAITSALGRYAKQVVCVDVLPEAIDNTFLTLQCETRAVQGKSQILKGDLDLLKDHVRKTGVRCNHLFFNNPVFRGDGNHQSLGGYDFELPKRALHLLKDVLDENGEAYFLACHVLNENGSKNSSNLWTVDKAKEFIDKEMPGWQIKELNYRGNGDKNWYYTIVRLIPPHK